MLDQKLRELLDFAKTTDLHEVAWEKNGTKISFRRAEGKAFSPKAAASQPGAASVSDNGAPAEPAVVYIRSTMVGTFMRGDSSERPPFVVEGTVVAPGQPVGSIEAMKIRKDVLSPLACRIVRSLVADGHAVEYGQPLYEVELTNGSDNENV
jgi:acetyl-CoA carboxylase biotin carboxyl carrier protein